MKHKKEIIRWACTPDGTGVYVRDVLNNQHQWNLIDLHPEWSPDKEYIVDDEYANLRIQQSYGKTIQIRFWNEFQGDYTEWVDSPGLLWKKPIEQYRVKP